MRYLIEKSLLLLSFLIITSTAGFAYVDSSKTAQIYNLVISQYLTYTEFKGKGFIIEDSTYAITDSAMIDRIYKLKSDKPSIRKFLELNRQKYPALRFTPEKKTELQWLSEDMIESKIHGCQDVNSSNEEKVYKWWHCFYRTFPGTAGIFSLSLPFIDKDSAILMYLFSHDNTWVSMVVISLKFKKNEWVVSGRVNLIEGTE
jgi:hypothetical protein